MLLWPMFLLECSHYTCQRNALATMLVDSGAAITESAAVVQLLTLSTDHHAYLRLLLLADAIDLMCRQFWLSRGLQP